jgi:hypothetical protein
MAVRCARCNRSAMQLRLPARPCCQAHGASARPGRQRARARSGRACCRMAAAAELLACNASVLCMAVAWVRCAPGGPARGRGSGRWTCAAAAATSRCCWRVRWAPAARSRGWTLRQACCRCARAAIQCVRGGCVLCCAVGWRRDRVCAHTRTARTHLFATRHMHARNKTTQDARQREAAAAAAHPGRRAAPVSWVQGDALALPFGDACFDAATVGYGLRNVADIPQVPACVCCACGRVSARECKGHDHQQAPRMSIRDWCLPPQPRRPPTAPLRTHAGAVGAAPRAGAGRARGRPGL